MKNLILCGLKMSDIINKLYQKEPPKGNIGTIFLNKWLLISLIWVFIENWNQTVQLRLPGDFS